MKTRSQIDDKYKWDLSLIYKNELQIENDKDELTKKVESLVKYENRIMESADSLLEVLQTSEDINRLMYKLYMYFHLNLDGDLGDSTAQNETNKILNLITVLSSKLSFIEPEIMKSENLDEYIDDEKLKAFKRRLVLLKRGAKHLLNSNEEKIMSTVSPLMGVGNNIYSTLVNSDMKFENTTDKDGNDVTVNEANYSKAIRSTDRVLRENFFKTLLNGYGDYNATLTMLLNSELQTKDISTSIRSYDDYRSRALFNNEVEEVVYDNLIKSVHENMEYNYNYLDYRKKCLDVEELHLYDTYVPIIEDVDQTYDYETGTKLAKESLKIFGEEYTELLDRCFNENWIDVYPNKGKRGGAYSSGSYDTVPYMLLNYTDGLDDVFTLVHEIGHSMHSYFSNSTQTSQDSHYKIFVAEIASTVNELILLDYLYKQSDDLKLKKYLLNYNLDQFRTTVYRQTMFAEFEHEINKKYFEEKSVSSDYLNEKYYALNELYFGSNVKIDTEIQYEWSRIPHFYYDFYVYQYATCFCVATYISEELINDNKDMKEKYLQFLKNGDSKDPISLIKDMGIDIRSKEVFDEALKKYENQLKLLIELGEKNE